MKKKIVVILLMLVVSVMIVGAIVYFLPAKTTNEMRVFTSKEISNLKEISVNGNFVVDITTSDSEDIKCEFTKVKKGITIGDVGPIESKIKNNILYINDGSKKNIICIGGGITEKVNIYIPKSYQNKLSVKSELNRINILNSSSKDINCDVKGGDITISLDNICGNVNVKSRLGNIDLKLPNDQKFNLSANSKLGEIDNKLNSNVDSSLTGKSINIDTLEGNITISGK